MYITTQPTTYKLNKTKYRFWKKFVPIKEKNLYISIQKTIDDTLANLYKYSEDAIPIIAEAIIKLRNEQKKLIYKYDFRRFVDELFSDVEDSSLQDKTNTPDFHIELYNAYQLHKRVCAVCPRGFGKSTTARVWLLHKILYNETRYIVIIGSSEDMAAQNLRWIRDQLVENPKIIEIFGQLYNKSKWSETEFITSTRISVKAKGAEQKIRGMNEKGRPDIIYIDDLEDDEMVETKDRRAKISKWFRQAVLPIISKNGKIIISGTILDNDSLLKNVSKNLVKDHIGWTVLFYQAVNLNPVSNIYSSLWEEHKSLKELQILASFDPDTFAKEYQNDPRAGGMAVFNSSWFNYYDPKFLYHSYNNSTLIYDMPLNIMCHTDFAVSEKSGADYSVILISGMSQNEKLYVLDYIRWRTADPYDMLDKLFAMCQKWFTDVISIETIAFQKVFIRMLEIEQEYRNYHLSIIELNRSQSTKLQRIKSLAAPIKKNLIFWTNSMPELEEELNAVTALKTGLSDDIIDTLADAFELQIQHSPNSSTLPTPINSYAWAVENNLL